MNVHISYKIPKDPSVEKEIHNQVNKLGKRLQVFRPELVHLRGVVEENSPREGFVMSLDLRLPSGDMAARESGSSHASVVKAVFDDLMEQVGKHKGHLRSRYKWPRRRVERERAEAQVPFEQTVAAVQPAMVSRDDISAWVNANLERLTRYVERELRYRENLGDLRPAQLKVEEVVDEAIASALDERQEKPELLALEPWLYRLAIIAIGSLARRTDLEVSSISLDHSDPQPNPHGSYESNLPYYQPDDDLPNRDIIPDPQVATPEATAASDEMITMVEAALLSAKCEDREAFLLFAVEGFTAEEIAAISNRTVQEVQQSIARARQHLQKALPVPNEFKDQLLQHSKIA